MADDKKYYWLKLKRDFFKRHDIQIIEDLPNGKDYVLFYLKLLCESVDHEGNLRFSEEIPYNEQMLASLTHTNVDIVRSAVKLFSELRMLDIMDDGTYYMNQVEKMIGSETYWAQKKREQRERNLEASEIGQCPTLSTPSPKCPSKSKDKEEDKEIELDNKDIIEDSKNPPPAPKKTAKKTKKPEPVKNKRGEYQHVLLTDEEEEKLIDEYGLEFALKAITFLDEYIEETGYKRKSHYLSIKRWVIDAVKEKEEKAIKKGDTPKTRYGNFDVDDAFQTALDRTYSDQPKTAADDEAVRERMEALKQRIGQGG